MPAPAASEQAIARALKAAQACGLSVTGFSVQKDGTVTVQTASPAPGPEVPEKKLDSAAANVEPMKARQWNRR